MTKAVPRDVKFNAVLMKRKGVNPEQITRSLPISRSTIYRAKRNLKKHGDVAEEKEKPGPHCLIPPGIGQVFTFLLFCLADMIQALLSTVLQVPDAYLEEYAQRLREKYKLDVSARTIGNFFRAKGITRKKVSLPLLF